MTPKQVKEIITLLVQEEKLSEEDKKKKAEAVAIDPAITTPLSQSATGKGKEMKTE